MDAITPGKPAVMQWAGERVRPAHGETGQTDAAKSSLEQGVCEKAAVEDAFVPSPEPAQQEDPLIFEVRYYKEKGGRNITEIKTYRGTIRLTVTKTLGYRPARDLTRLARANNPAEVRTLMASVYSQMRAAKGDKLPDREEIEAAVAQMKRVLQRAGAKIKQLGQEELLEHAEKNAARQDGKQSSQRAEELGRRRRARRAYEYAQANGAAHPGVPYGSSSIMSESGLVNRKANEPFEQVDPAGVNDAPILPAAGLGPIEA